MKRYQKFFSPIIIGLFIWVVGIRYCALTEDCAKPWPEVITIVSNLLIPPPAFLTYTDYFPGVGRPQDFSTRLLNAPFNNFDHPDFELASISMSSR